MNQKCCKGDFKRVLYHLYELHHAALAPLRTAASYSRHFWKEASNPLAASPLGKSMAAGLDLFERATRRYGKPEFGITSTLVDGRDVLLDINTVWSRPFCDLLHFERRFDGPPPSDKSARLLLVAPMSGHYATLLRGTVETMTGHCDVYVTDWADARTVPLSDGTFDLDDYADYLIEMVQFLGPDTHIMAVCQPSVPVLMAVAHLHQSGAGLVPASMTLMGGPVDTRRNPTAVNDLAVSRGIGWFRSNVITKVPFPHAGFLRDVYPGFLQLTGFMTMNLDRHMNAHRDLFWHLVEGDGDSAQKHETFYDEYMSVADLTAEFYLQTVEEVFIRHALPEGTLTHRGQLLDLKAITRTALMTVEGERDDISGVGQTEAAHDLCASLDAAKRAHHLQQGVGHYGVFNGRRFHNEIAPAIAAFIARHRTGPGTSQN